LAGRQSGKGEEPITGFLEAVGHRLAFEPPFAGKARRRTSISSDAVA
jgi:hypothetical protein